LRLGDFDVLIGVNLLREGLDLPEVSLVAILDADKEGFLRDERSLVQTVGRAARNVNGLVIMYADKITMSMEKTISETARRRAMQITYNEEHGQVPTALNKSKERIMESTVVADGDYENRHPKEDPDAKLMMAADPSVAYLTQEQLEKTIAFTKKSMEKAAKDLDFIEAARLRDELFALQKMKKE
jgi:excinuclease ABC subunit B